MKSILIIEDHDDSRTWWEANIGKVFPGSVVTGCATLEDARAILKEKHFSLALVDINLPDGSGIDLVGEIMVVSPETYCVVCTILDDDRHIFGALKVGARGYLVKDSPRMDQLEQLREIMTGKPPLSPGVARRVLNFFYNNNAIANMGGEASLSDRETEVLALIAKGYSRPEISRLLNISLNTVSGYSKSIYSKLNISNRAEAVVEACRRGLVAIDIH